MIVAKAFYFLFFGAMACLAPFLTLYYQDLGLSGREIGFLTGIVPLITMFGAALWGMIADATGRHRLLFLLAIIGTWCSVFLMTTAGSFLILIPIVVIYAFCFSPIIPLTDNSVIEQLGEERRDEYGRQRVWGSYGWGLAGAAIGVIIAASGLQWAFIAFLAIFVPLFLVGTRLPMSPYKAGSHFWSELRELLSNRSWLLFLAVALIEGMSMGIFLNYLFLYLDALGASATIMGLTLTMATISEIPVFLYSQRLLARWSAPFLLAISMIFVVIRAFAYVGMTDPWQVLLISLLHGPTFALMWVAGVAYAAEIAPPGLGATAQGVFAGVVMGLGSALGAFSGGILYDASGPKSAFYFAGFAALAATAVFVFVNRSAFRRQIQRAHP
jgi:PPP family 3-phenylpropionic acid transporter